jgi:hypothetical protein
MDGVCPSLSDLINKKCLTFFSKKKKKKNLIRKLLSMNLISHVSSLNAKHSLF